MARNQRRSQLPYREPGACRLAELGRHRVGVGRRVTDLAPPSVRVCVALAEEHCNCARGGHTVID